MTEAESSSTPYDAHPFEAPAEGADGPDAACRVCGERRNQIRHHPTRVRAARAIRGAGRGAPREDGDPRSG